MKQKLPDSFSMRAPALQDAAAINDLICACDAADYGAPDFTVEDVLADWRRDDFVIARDAWMIHASDGTLAAYGNVYGGSEVARVDPTTCVLPEYRERGLENFLLDAAEAWTRANAPHKPLQWIVSETHAGWVTRLIARAYVVTRHDYVMEIEMTAPPPAPVLPDGFVMRSFARGRDELAVWACLQESFRDHRGHVDMPYEAWATGFFDHAEWSPELSTVVTRDDETVAAAMAFHGMNGGWIRSLAVRRPWRKNGLGLAMLYFIFGKCYAYEPKRVGLGVDAESLTGATRLYERAGMRVKNHFLRYEKSFA